jgi:hypothetical protein
MTQCEPGEFCVGSECFATGCQVGFTRCGNTCAATQRDPQNCGGCGHSCTTDEVCIDGYCTDRGSIWLAAGLSSPSDLVTDGAKIYWTDIGNGTVNAIDKNGGTVLSLAQGQSSPLRLALDEGYVYWSNNSGNGIMRTLKDGSGLPELVTAATSPEAIAVDSQYVYFAGVGTIDRAPKAGGAAEMFVSLRHDPGVQAPSRLREMVSDGSALYGMVDGGLETDVWRFALPGGDTRFLTYISFDTATTLPLAVDSTYLYHRAGDHIQTVHWLDKLGGSAPQGMLYTNADNYPATNGAGSAATAVAPSSCGVVWTSGFYLFLTRFGAQAAIPLVRGQFNRILVEGDHVYWTDRSGAIGKLPLPL